MLAWGTICRLLPFALQDLGNFEHLDLRLLDLRDLDSRFHALVLMSRERGSECRQSDLWVSPCRRQKTNWYFLKLLLRDG